MKRTPFRNTVSLLIIVLVSFSGTAFADDADDAQEILRQLDARQPSGTSQTELTMAVYRDADATSSTREFRVESYSDGEGSTYMQFEEPRSIRGMKILSTDTASWVYFPSTGRVRKIAGESQGQSVQGVGGDFSYEDLGGGKLAEDYTGRLIGDTDKTWRIEAIPVKSNSSYSKLIMSIKKTDYALLSVEYYDGNGRHTKTLVLEEYESIDGYPTAMLMTMTNHNEGSKTVVRNHNISFNARVSANYFNPQRFYR